MAKETGLVVAFRNSKERFNGGVKDVMREDSVAECMELTIGGGGGSKTVVHLKSDNVI
ncbi:13215_t:CDS:2 [Gigaspora margarita]|uniref:13215_t:CDS:1 n=1 Tax=Gigaspora margarita TaxID=4874 RepID=A0ABN7UH02_GIGMA|nr:13215_t:CDS:2 [Gigaspora margarita]